MAIASKKRKKDTSLINRLTIGNKMRGGNAFNIKLGSLESLSTGKLTLSLSPFKIMRDFIHNHLLMIAGQRFRWLKSSSKPL